MSYSPDSFEVETNRFKGRLSTEECKIINTILKQKEIPRFKNGIYNFPYKFRREAQENGMSAYDYAESLGVLDKYVGTLRDYQTVGAAFLYRSPRSMLGDAAGIGKTPQICGMINAVRRNAENPDLAGTVYGNTKKILVAAEGSAVGQIAGEIEKFTGLRVVVLHSTAGKMERQTKKFYLTRVLDGTLPEPEPEDLPIEYTKSGKPKKPKTKKKKPVEVIHFDVLVITHSTLRSDPFFTWFSRVVKEFGTFILDESYVVKTPDTIISSYTKVLCGQIERVHFLNATVFETKLMDIVNQFTLIDPTLLPPKKWIEQNFCNYRLAKFPIRGGGGQMGNKWELVSYKNQEWFKQSLHYVYLTRKKKEVNLGATQRFYQTYLIKQTKAQKAAIRNGYRYFEVLNCPSLCVSLDIQNTPKDVPKLERLLQLMTEDFEDQQVMIYVWHIEMQETIKQLLEQQGRRVAILNGSTADRDSIRDGFNDGTYDVIITNAKRSLNLHSGDVCIFYSMETNPATIEQIAARIDRNVDESSKTFVLLAYEGEEADFFINTVNQRAVDGLDLADIISETVIHFGNLLLESLKAD